MSKDVLGSLSDDELLLELERRKKARESEDSRVQIKANALIEEINYLVNQLEDLCRTRNILTDEVRIFNSRYDGEMGCWQSSSIHC
jgi:hypothetical protein